MSNKATDICFNSRLMYTMHTIVKTVSKQRNQV